MFERFTDGARRVVVLAQEEARRLDHNYIGTEHLVLGLWAESSGGVAAVASELGLSLEMLRTEVEERIGRGDQTPGGHVPFTPGAKKALEMSLREALKLGHKFIGVEHLFLGVLTDENELGAQLLIGRGASVQRLRETVIPLIGTESSGGGSLGMGGVACAHPNAALVWEPVDVAGPDDDLAVIVIRCQACGRALTALRAP